MEEKKTMQNQLTEKEKEALRQQAVEDEREEMDDYLEEQGIQIRQ
jgi:hypothetical protein